MDNTNLNVDELLHALDNENNSSIINLTTSKIKSAKNDVLHQLQLPRDKLKALHKNWWQWVAYELKVTNQCHLILKFD